MKVIVVGGGKVGYFLAQTLTEHGHEPHIVEKDKHLCAKIANELDYPVVCGDCTLIEVLEGAGARDAEGLVAVTGRDEDNLVACQLAKQYFGIKRRWPGSTTLKCSDYEAAGSGYPGLQHRQHRPVAGAGGGCLRHQTAGLGQPGKSLHQ